MNTIRILTAAALFATGACSQQSLLKGQPYAEALLSGFKNDAHLAIPIGRVQIMSDLSSQMEVIDWSKHKFPSKYLDLLQRAQKDGLLTLAEEQQSQLDSIRNMGSRFFAVTPTEKLQKMNDAPKVIAELAATVLTATFEILQVLKEQEYKPPVGFGGPGDEFRLVLGTVRRRPTPDAITLGKSYCVTEVQELKFRAVLQYNPFAKTYSFRAADLGNPQDPGWNTETVK
jgi:hypothetical protein